MMRRRYAIALAAGGTGGHVIPAHALAVELARRGHRPMLVTDWRGLRYAHLFPGLPVHDLNSARLQGGLIGRLLGVWSMLLSTVQAIGILRRTHPACVVGFGGYPSLPTGLAAALLGIPLCLHEQNAVFGRSNRFLSRLAAAVALSFEETERHPSADRQYVVVTGNPIRRAVAALSGSAYAPPEADGEFRLLVIGGSQGAQILSEVVPAAISALPRAAQQRLSVVQQCREEDMPAVRAAYAATKVRVETAAFLDDLPQRLADAHLVIARAGASTVTELSAAGRPSILVPLPTATDDHQWANAQELVAAGGAWVIRQDDFTPPSVAKLMQNFARNPHKLEQAARAAAAVGRVDAAAALADLVEQVVVAFGPLDILPLPERDHGLAMTGGRP